MKKILPLFLFFVCVSLSANKADTVKADTAFYEKLQKAYRRKPFSRRNL